MLVPRAADFIQVLLNQFAGLVHARRTQAIICSELHSRFDPELRFTGRMLRVNVRPRFFAREEIKPKTTNAKHRGAHGIRITEPGAAAQVVIALPRPVSRSAAAPRAGIARAFALP